MKSIAESADGQSTCCSIGGMQLVYNCFFKEYKEMVNRSRRREESKGVRWITSIDKDMVDLVKIFLDSGMQVKHLKNLIHMDFAVDNKNFNATIDKMEGGKLMEDLLISNEPAYVSLAMNIVDYCKKQIKTTIILSFSIQYMALLVYCC